MTIRPARPADAPAIAALLHAAFNGEAEAALVAALREAGDVAIELVAEAPGGEVLGHVLFSPMMVGATPALALAPLAVVPRAQLKGIGSALLREGLVRAAARPEAWCLVLGEPDYYGRFGFRAALAAQVTGVPWAGHPAFQALPLVSGAPPLNGDARYAPAFGMFG